MMRKTNQISNGVKLALLKKHKIRPNKRLGQNFLTSKIVLKKIIKAADLKPSDIVLEIGPGLGILTKELAKMVKKVVAVEKDRKLADILKEELDNNGIKNVKIINQDILNTKYQILNTKYKLVANLPYYITSPVIRKFLEAKNPPKEMVLMVQKEVGKRICACPPDMTRSTGSGSSRAGRGMSILAVSVQFYAKPEIISYISKKSFWPSPKVDSAIIKISAFNQRRKSAFNQRFFKIVKAGFSQPRKQLINNFSKSLELSREKVETWLKGNKIQPSQRAETLTLKNWLDLTNDYCFFV